MKNLWFHHLALNYSVCVNGQFYGTSSHPLHKGFTTTGRACYSVPIPNPAEPPSDTNKPEPFDLYSMRQAIEEGFILDVLRNYTPYKLAFKLTHNGKDYDDATVDQSDAVKSLMRWVRLHPYNIAQKVQIIVEHFRQNVVWQLDGHAKAMVVTGSRKEAVRYKIAIDKYIKAQGYADMATLVAFSGEVNDPESGPTPFTEYNMNTGLKGRDLRDAFDTDEFQVLLVANKYQTGFDQPKLVAMYVDKKLAGVAAVQTLSRLNRTYPGKDQTYTIDFVNTTEDIKAAFQPYYQNTELEGVSNPYIILDLQNKLDDERIYTPEEVDLFVTAYFKGKQSDMQAHIAPAVERYRVRTKDATDANDRQALDGLQLFRKDITGFIRAYDFLSQIVSYGDTDLEKRAIFYKHLAPWLRNTDRHDAIDLSSVRMTHYKLSHMGKQTVQLSQETDGNQLKPLVDVGSGKPHDPQQALLSAIIGKMNDLFEGDLDENDKLALVNHVAGKMLDSETLEKQAAANTKEQFGASPDYKTIMLESVAEGLDKYQDMAKQVLNSEKVQAGLAELLLEMVYAEFAKRRQDTSTNA